MHVGRSAIVAAFALSLNMLAHAESEDVVLDYRAFTGCPDRARFEAEVRALSERAHFVQTAPAARLFRVRLERSGKGVEGSLEISRKSERSERKMSGKDCAEVASALALATAIAVDPSVLGDESAPPEHSEPAAKPEPKPVLRAAPGAPNPSPEPDRKDPPAVSESSRVLVGLGGGLQSAIAPGAATRFALRVGWQPPGRWSPLSFIEGAYALPVSTNYGKFTDLFTLRAGASLRLLESERWSSGPELSMELGNVKASGNPALVENARSDQALWAAGELGVFGRWQTQMGLLMEIAGGALLPFVRRDYTYRPKSPAAEPVVAHSIPSVGFSLSLRVAVFL